MSPHDLTVEEVRACPLCGAPAPFDAHDTAPDELLALLRRAAPAGTFGAGTLVNDRVRCRECGFVFLSPRLDPASLSAIYSAWYSHGYRDVFDDPVHVAERERIFRDHHLALLQAHVRPEGRLLDVGCGSGIFMKIARDAGWRQVVGVELDRTAAEFARSAHGLDVRHGSLEDSIGERERFDVITMFDYLEHSSEPGRELDRAAGRLTEGGVLAIRVPNQGGWLSRRKGARWYNVISNHLGYFEAPVLCDALRRRGLRIEYASAPNFDSLPAMAVRRARWVGTRLRAARSARPPEHAGGVAAAPGATVGATPGDRTALASRVWRLLDDLLVEQFDHVAGSFGKGSNLFVVARRVR